ncbi:hypothetical protein IFM89_028236 [Coptis chinensis]|uniref:Uncharacterized protein n=1 Tax=Coptis chinensis TaxID=261450 RepID=A0A835IRS8_9MAGN|nr:hypothetical protein IFM89_028236 [Coptis chinensis]
MGGEEGEMGRAQPIPVLLVRSYSVYATYGNHYESKPLIALIFYEVSGGPFGVEDSVKAGGGPLLSLLGFLIFPLLWSVPKALVIAKRATSFPKNGGYVLWISAAFGPFWGFQEGFLKWFGGVLDNALYPILFLDYLKRSFPIFNRLIARIPALLGLTVSLTYLNYRGLNIVGLQFPSLAFFAFAILVMGLLSIPRIRPKKWLVVDFSKRQSSFGHRSWIEWSDGYFAEVGMLVGGFWLKWWIQATATMSNLGLFEAEMSSDAFQLLRMSEMGMLPAIFALRSKYGTPTISILWGHLLIVDELSRNYRIS